MQLKSIPLLGVTD